MVDANCKFLFIDVGCNGRASDSTIYKECYLYKALQNQTLNIPTDRVLFDNKKIPHFFIGDDAFPLSDHLMKPFNRNLRLSVAEEILNYRLCRARMVVECAFGRLAQRFRIFHRPIEVIPCTVDLIVKCCCVLHNYVTKNMTPSPEIESCNIELPDNFSSIGSQIGDVSRSGNQIRKTLANYFVTDGAVDFQWQKINR